MTLAVVAPLTHNVVKIVQRLLLIVVSVLLFRNTGLSACACWSPLAVAHVEAWKHAHALVRSPIVASPPRLTCPLPPAQPQSRHGTLSASWLRWVAWRATPLPSSRSFDPLPTAAAVAPPWRRSEDVPQEEPPRRSQECRACRCTTRATGSSPRGRALHFEEATATEGPRRPEARRSRLVNNRSAGRIR